MLTPHATFDNFLVHVLKHDTLCSSHLRHRELDDTSMLNNLFDGLKQGIVGWIMGILGVLQCWCPKPSQSGPVCSCGHGCWPKGKLGHDDYIDLIFH